MEIYRIFEMWWIMFYLQKESHLFNNFVFLFCNKYTFGQREPSVWKKKIFAGNIKLGKL